MRLASLHFLLSLLVIIVVVDVIVAIVVAVAIVVVVVVIVADVIIVVVVLSLLLLLLLFLVFVCLPGKEALLAVGVDGIAKHWLLPSRTEMLDQGVIVEEKSQVLNLDSPPLSLSSYCYQGTYCTVLVVCEKTWQVCFGVCVCVCALVVCEQV